MPNTFGENFIGSGAGSDLPLPYAASSEDDAVATQASATRINQQRSRVTGRLISLANVTEGMLKWLESGRSSKEDTGGIVAVSFPSMPEVLELARESEYRVAPIYMAPDGIHQYLNTKPLEIPVSFQLSVHDREYCTHGALTLLATAAKLHAMVLPVNTSTKNRLVMTRTAGTLFKEPGTGGSVSTDVALNSAVTTPSSTVAKDSGQSTMASEPTKENQAVNSATGGESSTFPPVAVFLDLISDGRASSVSLGVSCVGYIRNVRCRFKGPWLQPPNGGKNLPSKLEAEFVFVHFPGYTNRFAQTGSYDQVLVNAYAEEVRSNFYNLGDKSIASNLGSLNQGTGELGSTSSYQGVATL